MLNLGHDCWAAYDTDLLRARQLISERLSHALFTQIRGAADMLVSLHTMNPLFDSKLYCVYKVHPGSGVSEQAQLKMLSAFNPNVACRQNVAGAGELLEAIPV